MVFPEEITSEELDNLYDSGEIRDYETFCSLEDARSFINAFKRGLSDRDIELYTQIDSEGGTVYLRGEHVVNRTGVYLVIWR